ncbi:hypothetical protein N431DRAFT_222451 [Stipitochalara longipes BDJ]|nr:hypothetical protein N431DRAFT_222451 [Stipitochalara longipes BDJ]
MMVNAYLTMKELKRTTAHNDENVPPPKPSLIPEEWTINNAIICMLRHARERRLNERNRGLGCGF